ncbi:hypothetical protein FB45DRAFT_1011411 [Roridomyces roridus]|uniref:Uncharacterized protein n=1 Tax=Roridomyces roridus TaxID=1738132 RepID=A0AAD7B1G1_9AGAR|nr:hypothetical protein FB45DRAFT_1011411 [Roridomyces roridus]
MPEVGTRGLSNFSFSVSLICLRQTFPDVRPLLWSDLPGFNSRETPKLNYDETAANIERASEGARQSSVTVGGAVADASVVASVVDQADDQRITVPIPSRAFTCDIVFFLSFLSSPETVLGALRSVVHRAKLHTVPAVPPLSEKRDPNYNWTWLLWDDK